ncbi:BMY1 [Symbiodinium necroappetens]|uniref:BMY1 protein n=1 Tax=Symbiodinium necroappetens TaxID=1628268 RepID=A0A813C1D7_9DINO|nr:BMY1 [Symbiodinium necroappetens]
MLASLVSGCGAAFLKKRAGASTHVRSACGYAVINWCQSVFAALTLTLDIDLRYLGREDSYKFGCRYGLMPYADGTWAWVCNSLRLLFFLTSLVWMQCVVARRIDLLEQTSHQTFYSDCFRGLVAGQALWAIVVALVLCPWAWVSLIDGGAPWYLGLAGISASVITWLLNVAASIRAMCCLTRCFLLLRSILRFARLEDTSTAARLSLRRAQTFALLQTTGVSFSLVLTILVVPAALVTTLPPLTSAFEEEWLVVAVSIQALDSLGNAAAAVLLSGSHRLHKENRPYSYPNQPGQSSQWMSCLICTQPRAVTTMETTWSLAWKAKVAELSLRGMTLRSLLLFYQDHLPSMPGWRYAPKDHKTKDVVRRAIIPLTSREESSYAVSALNRDGARRAAIMVTHNWGNNFKDLLAAIVSDALQECSFNLAARLLEEDVALMSTILSDSGRLDDTYWVCAFAVNQHTSICHTNPKNRDPFTDELHPVCSCSSVNISDPDGQCTLSEINKFDDMMYLLAATGGCRQVIAVDQSLDLFKRAWCVAEIAEAKRLQMTQQLKLSSIATILQRAHTLSNLDVGKMEASCEKDRELILKKIEGNMTLDQFNAELRSLIFDPRSGLLTAWRDMDSVQQIGEVGRLIRWGLADAGTGKVWKAWEAQE